METRWHLFALGSPHGDDSIAWWIAQYFIERPIPGVAVHQIRTPWDLLNGEKSSGSWIVIDACQSGAPAGTIHRFNDFESICDREEFQFQTTHGGDLKTVLAMSQRLGWNGGRLMLIAIEVEACEPCTELSEMARRAGERVVQELCEIAQRDPDL